MIRILRQCDVQFWEKESGVIVVDREFRKGALAETERGFSLIFRREPRMTCSVCPDRGTERCHYPCQRPSVFIDIH